MSQFLVILRGAPASGKTTISKQLRNFDQKIVWLKVDNFKDFFAEEPTQEQQRYVDESALATLEYLLEQGFSVVMEKIFFDPFIIPLAIEAATKKGITTKVFELRCSLSILQARDRNRIGIKEGHRRPLGDKVINEIYTQLEKTHLPNALTLDTEKQSQDQCVNEILNTLR